MGFFRQLQTYFNNHAETNERHYDEKLKTRYYKVTAKKTMEIIRELSDALDGYSVTSFSEEHGEMSVNISKGRKAFMVITVFSVKPFETAVDFSVTTDTKFIPFDFGFSRKVILMMYDKLDKVLPFIGSGRYSE
jgi:hypothetical protein